MIKQVIRLFPGFQYGLRRDTIIKPQHLVGQIDGIVTVEDAKQLIASLVTEGYLKYKQSVPSKIGQTMAGWIFSDKGWQVYSNM